jgi:flagellar hook-length control protein FliK
VSIAPRLASPEWQPAFANSVKLLVNEGASAATLQLNPAEFGPIDVRIVVSDQRADISFMVAHPDANAAIQSSLAELRDQLARSGIQLGQASVGAHPQHPREPAPMPRRVAAANPAAAAPGTRLTAVRSRGHGTIDIYA